ncbi:hypothetical protein BSL82_01330 [Tardibacter chloracetimidivorans]|uniref:Glycoside hydrolase family 19 catalytic domain-containing protein n=1 Tax=Tardibacter chloracetimidivorans TaxID=1921510 RepID=A0A1L3ZR46_9SPHN|nr:glycoside hydrolase family 19 protein [Tardibacter chloracetimidivorans]API58106.1 hypothetical protein BSL82_01330 [Tardibacter chloracetimidivorans]
MKTADIQRRLGVAPDGIWGPVTWAALFTFCGCKDARRAKDLGFGANAYLLGFDISTPLRIAHFMAQAAHETGGFRWLEEIWGPTLAQMRYEGRRDLGNVKPGDGQRFKGRGIFQLTGRGNYEDYGKTLGLDLIAHPYLAADPGNSVLIAGSYWKRKGLNALADADNCEKITRAINGGLNGFPERLAYVERLKGLLL